MASVKKKQIGTRVRMPIYRTICDIADKKESNISDILRKYTMDGIALEEDIEHSDTMKRIIQGREKWRRNEEALMYFELENKRVSESVMKHTFLDYVDKTLVQLKFKMTPYYSEEEVNQRLQDHLETFRDRAEYHGLEDRIERRIEDPHTFIKKRLDRQGKEHKLEDL